MKTKLQARGGGASALWHIFSEGGVGPFYAGVSSTMAGQAVIKGVLFFVYSVVKDVLATSHTAAPGASPSMLDLCIASAFAGFVASFVVTPVERIKIVMQVADDGFSSPLECAREVVRRDGVRGLLCRGINATLAREVPAYIFYLVTYERVKQALHGAGVPPGSLLVGLGGGAAAGVMAWLPVYPFDVIKTHVQLEEGDKDVTMIEVARKLARTRGPGVFCDGLASKLARAVVNHITVFITMEQLLLLNY